MSDIILHHYPASPFAEKIRLIFGLKGLAWKSVKIPMVMPKPDLMPLTGGYRKTPVMQIGADIYCDTVLIARELERRHPAPTLYPHGSEAVSLGLSFWTDKTLFRDVGALVFGSIGEQMPEAFLKDRAEFRGAPFDIERMKAAVPNAQDQVRAALEWVETGLADGRKFLLGDAPGLADLNVYFNVWFLQRAAEDVRGFLDGFRRIADWSARVAAIGHGDMSVISSGDALEIARDSEPAASESTDAGDPRGLKPGARVSVSPDDTGRVPVEGVLAASGSDRIVIRRSDPRIGEVAVHFPRAGYRVLVL